MIFDSIEQQQHIIGLVRSAQLRGTVDEVDNIKKMVIDTINAIAESPIASKETLTKAIDNLKVPQEKSVENVSGVSSDSIPKSKPITKKGKEISY